MLRTTKLRKKGYVKKYWLYNVLNFCPCWCFLPTKVGVGKYAIFSPLYYKTKITTNEDSCELGFTNATMKGARFFICSTENTKSMNDMNNENSHTH